MKNKKNRTTAFAYFCRRLKSQGNFNYFELDEFLCIYLNTWKPNLF